MSKYKA